ncbi:MAG: nitroreductase, partial [Emcibacteraceae bacterium]|nr:nitroreductase [Emcibacteraceae bacterium]
RRRSLTVKDMTGPGPTDDEIQEILAIASRVPDHKKQVPWRYIIFKDNARQQFGSELRKIFKKNNPEVDNELLNFEENRLMRAPLVIAVISQASPHNPKVPEWEQILTAGAVCQNILLSANALGYAGQWLSEWYAYDVDVLNVMKLEKEERVAGFLYIGRATKEPAERGRPNVEQITEYWSNVTPSAQ